MLRCFAKSSCVSAKEQTSFLDDEDEEKGILAGMFADASKALDALKAKADATTGAWQNRTLGEVGDLKTALKEIDAVKQTFVYPKKFCEEAEEFAKVMKTLQLRVKVLVKAREKLDKQKTAESTEKHRQQESETGSATREVAIVAKLRQYLMDHAEATKINVATVMSECIDKMQKVAATPPEHYRTALVDKIVALPYFETHRAWVADYLVKNGLTGANSDIASQKAYKEVSQLVRSCTDQRLLKNLSGEQCVKECFLYQFWFNTKFHASLAFNFRCLPECRLTLQGSEVLS